MPPSLHVRPMRAGVCTEPDRCIGFSEAEAGAALTCVCYDEVVQAAEAAERMVEAVEVEAVVKETEGGAEAVGKLERAGAEEAVAKGGGTAQAVAQRPHPLLPDHTISGFSSGGDMAMIHLVRVACVFLLCMISPPLPSSPESPLLSLTGRLLLRHSGRHSGGRRAVRMQPPTKLEPVSRRQANLPVPPKE